ncbi:winged helix-turn-helix transcriptional regulator [Haloferax sp. KTX1]|uniref:helix-turn-helix transcriptional regulator n=1 Tax=Haloferax sp. KTX1 TaxID=2600597 RepID=UPI002103709A|nr:winged helix-turn-helix transcriptional regulator [Haloferax sp. KTX1]
MADCSNDDTHLTGTGEDAIGADGGSTNYRRVVASRVASWWAVFIGLTVALSNQLGFSSAGEPAGAATHSGIRRSPEDVASSIRRETDTPGHAAHAPDLDAGHPLLGVDPELLNSERRILQLLIVEGGRLPQSQVAERTRWSDSTISRTLCRMETQGRIRRFQLGSGKCVVLPQDDE